MEVPVHTQNFFNPSTAALRARVREYSIQERANARAAASDGIRFGLGEIKARLRELEDLTEKDVHGLGTRIKRRKHATCEDMYRLSHAFLQSNNNINAFANIPGALQVVVKELTGKNAERQVSAAECLCNLSLGEAHVCEKISNAVGGYLITYLDSSEERLKRTSLWTIANILDTSQKAAETLLRMELLRKLWANYIASHEDYCVDAAICIVLVSRKRKGLLKENDLQFFFENIEAKHHLEPASEYHLEIMFNLELINDRLSETHITYLIKYALSNLQNCTDLKNYKERLQIVFAIRVLANVLAFNKVSYHIFFKQLGPNWQLNLSALFNKLFVCPEKSLLKETLWLLNNVISVQRRNETFVMESFLQNICIPRGALI